MAKGKGFTASQKPAQPVRACACGECMLWCTCMHVRGQERASERERRNKRDEKDREQSDRETCPMRSSKIFM